MSKAKKKSFLHANKDTVLGFTIITAVSLLGVAGKEQIKVWYIKKRKKKEMEDHEKQVKFDNEQEIKLYEQKLMLRKKYGCPDDDCQVNEEERLPLPPVLNNPLDGCLAVQENRLFASAIHVGECGIVAASKGVGKTILMMQVAMAIAEGKPTNLWPRFGEGNHSPQKVLYYDGELARQDMFDRYEKFHHKFPDNFQRHDRSQLQCIEDVLRDIEANEPLFTADATIVIDNVTKFLDTSQVSLVNDFNKRLEAIHARTMKRDVRLTIILVVHVLAKNYTEGNPIQIKDIAGASNLMNFQNFIIALETPKGRPGPLAVHVLASRSEPEPNCCCLLQLNDPNNEYAHFTYTGEMDGNDKVSWTPLEEALAMQQYLRNNHTQEETAKKFGCTRQTVINRLKLLNNQKDV